MTLLRKLLFAVATFLFLNSYSLADPPITGTTKCSTIVDYFDRKDNVHTRESYDFIKARMIEKDQFFIRKGKGSALAGLNEQGELHTYVMAVEFCRADRNLDLGRATDNAYDGHRGLREMLLGR